MICSAGITSTSFMSAGGLKKCIPTTFSGRFAAEAMDVTRIEEVLVASTASSGSDAKISRFSSSRSGAASMMSSQPSRSPVSGS